MSTKPTPPNRSDLTSKQREILRVIAEHPDATQREIAEMMDIAAPTVSNHVNAIDEFDWRDREEFVTAIFESDGDRTQGSPASEEVNEHGWNTVERLSKRLDALEEQVLTLDAAAESEATFQDPELTHKVLRACMESNAISEDEELEIMQSLLGGGR